MVEQWFYRMFGEEFGPVPFEELKELADRGSLSALDEVRSAGSEKWVAAHSIEQLDLQRDANDSNETIVDGDDAPRTNSKAGTAKGADEWYCIIGGSELGPLTFEELLEYAENEQLAADDEVKLGAHGKWRRVGSIGRLMAAIPYKAIEKSIVPTISKAKTPPFEQPVMEDFEDALEESSRGKKDDMTEYLDDGQEESEEEQDDIDDMSSLIIDSPRPAAPGLVPSAIPNAKATFHAAYEEAKAKIAQSMMAQAEAAFKTSVEQAKAQLAWASATNVDRQWWGWASGVEFGPVEFAQVLGLAKSGQLKPTDLIRNGQFGHFAPSSNVPGLFNAIAMIAKAAETLALARSQTEAAVALALPPPNAPAFVLNPLPIPVPVPTTKTRKTTTPTKTLQTKTTPSTRTTPTSRTETATRTLPTPAIKSDPSVHVDTRFELMEHDLDSAARIETQISTESIIDSCPSKSTPPAVPRASESVSPIGGFHTSSISIPVSPDARRPATVPKKLAGRPSAGSGQARFSGVLEQLKGPKAIRALCAIGLVLLIVGWNLLPKNRTQDIEYYRALIQIHDEIRSKRNSPNELAALVTKARKTAKEIADDLKKKVNPSDAAKKYLLAAARDEFPRACQTGFDKESKHEKAFASRLDEAAFELGLQRRPRISAFASQSAPIPVH